MINNKFKHYYVHADNSVSTFDPSEIESNTPHVITYFHNADKVLCYYKELMEGEVADDVSSTLEAHLYEMGIVDEDEGLEVSNTIIDNIDTIKSNVTSVIVDVNNYISDFIDDVEWLAEDPFDDMDPNEESLEDIEDEDVGFEEE